MPPKPKSRRKEDVGSKEKLQKYKIKPEDKEDINVSLESISSSFKSQLNSGSSQKFLLIKLLCIAAIVGLFLIDNASRVTHRAFKLECMIDSFQDWTTPINEYLKENVGVRNVLLAVASFLIDFNILMLLGRWVWFSPNLRLFWVITPFYFLRVIYQNTFFLGFPKDYIFHYPGFPTAVVPYGMMNDFFFSGHMGICYMCLAEYRRDKHKVLQYIGWVSVPIEFFTLLVTRKHHFTDLVFGILLGHYFVIFGDWLQDYIDRKRDEGVLQKELEWWKKKMM